MPFRTNDEQPDHKGMLSRTNDEQLDLLEIPISNRFSSIATSTGGNTKNPG